jgi:hypothetical protein
LIQKLISQKSQLIVLVVDFASLFALSQEHWSMEPGLRNILMYLKEEINISDT